MNIPFLILIVLGVLLATVLLSLNQIKGIIRIYQTKTCNMNALPLEGLVEVIGAASSNDMVSPVNKTPCVFWEVEIKELKSSGKSSNWKTVHKSQSTECFEIRDEMGRALIDPAEAGLVLANDKVNEPAIEVAGRYGLETKGLLGFDKKFRVTERTIKPGQKVLVLGSIVGNDGRRTIGKLKGSPFILSDRSEKSTLMAYYQHLALWFLISAAVGAFLYLAYGR